MDDVASMPHMIKWFPVEALNGKYFEVVSIGLHVHNALTKNRIRVAIEQFIF